MCAVRQGLYRLPGMRNVRSGSEQGLRQLRQMPEYTGFCDDQNRQGHHGKTREMNDIERDIEKLEQEKRALEKGGLLVSKGQMRRIILAIILILTIPCCI